MYTHPQNQTVEIKRTHFTGYSIKHTKSKKNMKNLLLTISTPVSLTSLAFTEILLRRTYCYSWWWLQQQCYLRQSILYEQPIVHSLNILWLSEWKQIIMVLLWKKTMRVNGHVLTEKYVKQYKWECIVKSNIDLGNGDHVLITFFTSLWQERPLEDQETKPLDLDHYKIQEPRELLWTWSKAIYKIET